MQEEVSEHLKQIIEIGTIQPLLSPWASPIVLVCKKDGKFQVCIDLRKLNAHMIKDSYSLPRVEDTLESLNGGVWFTALGLKSGYWQVEMDEASKPLMAFTVSPLGFYECDHMYLDWWMLWLHSRGWWRHVCITFSSTGASFTSMIWWYFQKCQKKQHLTPGWEQSSKSWKKQG